MPTNLFGDQIEVNVFGDPVDSAPPTGPLTPEEQAKPTMSAPPPQMGTGEEMARTGRKMVNGALFGLLPQGAGAIDASVPALSGETGATWMDRYRSARDKVQGHLAEDSAKLRHPDIDEFVGGLATGGALRKVLPTNLESIRKLPKVLRAVFGVGEASAINAGVGAAKNWDDPEKAKEGALEGATSPWNALGAAGPALESLAPLFGRRALARSMRSVKPSAEDVESLRQTFGTPEEAARFLKDAKLPDGTRLLEPGDKPEVIFSKLTSLRNWAGQQKKAFTDMAHSSGASVDTDAMMQKIGDVYREFSTPEARTADPNAVDRLAQAVGRIYELREKGYRGQGAVEVPGTQVNGQAAELTTNIHRRYDPRMTSLPRWEDLKSRLQTAAEDAFANEKSTPVKSALGKISSIIKTADEEALGKALGPEAVDKFVQMKDLYGRASAMEDVARRHANSAAAEAPRSSTSTRLLRAAVTGAGAGAYTHDPRVGLGSAAAAAALGEAADSFDRANPRMARTYDWLREHLPEKVKSTSPLAPVLKRALGGDQ